MCANQRELDLFKSDCTYIAGVCINTTETSLEYFCVNTPGNSFLPTIYNVDHKSFQQVIEIPTIGIAPISLYFGLIKLKSQQRIVRDPHIHNTHTHKE